MKPHRIPYPAIEDIAGASDPVSAILDSAEFHEAGQIINRLPLVQRSLVPAAGQAFIYALIRNLRPSHVVEIGTYRGGTTEVMALALEANGGGTVHTVGPFDQDHFLPIMQSWSPSLQDKVRFYPVDSMNFYMKLDAEGIRPALFFIDGHHDYEFALFDIQCGAKSVLPGGFIIVDDINQAGPYYAAVDFLASRPDWRDCDLSPKPRNLQRAFDPARVGLGGMGFLVMRAPTNYLILQRPRVFAPVRLNTNVVLGLKLTLAEASSGTLDIQCVVRGFGPTMTEVFGETALTLDRSEGSLSATFKNPIITSADMRYWTVEPWLSWTGAQPLALSKQPEPF